MDNNKLRPSSQPADIKTKNVLILLYIFTIVSLHFYTPLGVLSLMAFFIFGKEYLSDFVSKLYLKLCNHLSKNHVFWLYIPALPLLITILHPNFLPPDDLLRHMISYQHNYDYSHYYGYAESLKQLTFSPWFGFEWATGCIHKGILFITHVFINNAAVAEHFADKLTIKVVGGIALAWWLWLWVPLVKQRLNHVENGYLTGCFLTLCILGSGLGERLLLGRPEIIYFLAMLSVWRMRPWTWLALMVTLQISYYLSFLYAIGAFLIPGWSWKKRILAFLGLFITCVTVWNMYAGWHPYFQWVVKTYEISRNTEFSAYENLSIIYFFVSMYSLFFLPLCYLFISRVNFRSCTSIDWAHIGVAILFLFTDQFRYTIYAIPLIAYILLFAWSQHKSEIASAKMVVLANIFGAIIIYFSLRAFTPPFTPFQTLHEGDWVLTNWNKYTFLIPLYHPNVKVVSSMDIRLADSNVQNATRTLRNRDKLDMGYTACAALYALPKITHLVEQDTIKGVIPPCLKLQETEGGWRLWKITPHGSAAL